MKVKILKKKAFQAKGVDHTHYTVAYKGRVFGVSTMRFEEGELQEETGDILSIPNDVEVLKHVSTDNLTGETSTFLDIVPKSGLVIAEF